jgi:hypothetical protein
VIDLSEKRMKEHLMQEVAFRRKEQVPSIHRESEKANSRKPVQPRSYWRRSYRTVPPCIGPATSAVHRVSERNCLINS